MGDQIAGRKPVSVILTVKNESASINRLLSSLMAQTRRPDEVVIVDGGSTDGTEQTIQKMGKDLPIVLLRRDGFNISQGRNAAIRAASHDLIASTDAGVRLSPEWLEELVRPLEGGAADVVSGFFDPDPASPFEIAMGATVLPSLADVDPATFLPSSRSVAFTRRAWETVGGYPEWLDYCEDLVFDMRLRAVGLRFQFAPLAVAHFRPRSSVKSFFRQYYLYARGDGKADLWRKRHLIRYGTYLGLLAFLGHAAYRRTPLPLLPLGVGAAAYLRAPYRRIGPLAQGTSASAKLQSAVWVPAIRLVGDVAKMIGYPAGLLWRRKHKSSLPNWRTVDTAAERELARRQDAGAPSRSSL